MKIYRRLVGERIFPGDQGMWAGTEEENLIDFLPSFLLCGCQCYFFPRIRHYYQSLSITWGSELIRSVLIHLWFWEPINRDNSFVWLFSALSMDSDLNIPQRVTWGSLKVIPPDNLLMLVRLIDESIAEIPQACSRIRLVERHASADQYWHLLEEGGTLNWGWFFRGAITGQAAARKRIIHESRNRKKERKKGNNALNLCPGLW